MNGRILTGIAVFVGLAAFVQVSFGQLSPLEKYEREIIVEFRPGTIQMPAGETSVPPNKLDTLKPLVAEVIERHGADLVLVAFPGYDPADTIAISPTGELVKKPDLSLIYKIRFPEGTNLNKVVEELSALPDVVYAERIPRYEYYVTPNDEYFNLQWGLHNTGQAGGTPDADIDAPEAWDIATGISSVKLGILDCGIDENHVDLSGKVSGDAGYSYEHGTHVAGIAAAKTNNNNEGIAGVNWYAQLHDEDISWDQDPTYIDPDKVYPAIISAVDAGCHVLNNSWGGPDYSITHRRAFAYAYKMNRVAVVSMGNEGSSDPRYPAAYGQGIIAVGATENDDARWSLSNTGNHIDVVAPGGNGYPWDSMDIYSTLPNDDYDYRSGTSMAAPFVTGLAGLLKGYNTDLYNDDIEQIIRISADTVPLMLGQEWTPEYGDGRINARKALDLLRSPNQLKQWNVSGGSVVDHGSSYEKRVFIDVPGLATGVYLAKWYRVQKGATFLSPFVSTPYAWGRGVGTNGFSIANPNYGMGWCRVVPGSITPTTATLETYVYDVYTISGGHVGWVPCSPSNVQLKYTALGEPASVHLSGWMECLNPPKSGGEPKDVYHFRAHLSWTYNGPLNHYELWRKLKNPRYSDPTGWVKVYHGTSFSFVDPYDFHPTQGAWYYVKAYFTGSLYVQSNMIYLEAVAPQPCPFLYIWNVGEFIEDNNILSGSGNGEIVEDWYKLREKPVKDGNRYRLQLREESSEHSFLDRLRLIAIDHPDSVEIFVAPDAGIIPVSSMLASQLVIGENGVDYTYDLLDFDNIYVEANEVEKITADFGETNGGDYVILAPPGPKPRLMVEKANASNFEPVGFIRGRENPSCEVLPLTVSSTEDVSLRFTFTDVSQRLDYIRFGKRNNAPFRVRPCPLLSAVHSDIGSVRLRLLTEDERYAELMSGDTLSLEFIAPVKRPGWVRDFVFVSNGRYIRDGGGGSQTAGGKIPAIHFLSIYPNPVKNDMTIRFGIPREERVSIKVYDISGREAKTLVDERLEAGYHTIKLDGKNFPSGIYFARLVTDGYEATKKIVLMK
ncbi:hypothetical protein CH333_05105 [candidate division WOR-3 bacterium JGI_Cruoil_03_44_89]|uniref:Peptidase S8/S53 domain-containing protein n=1 Tax=candidate division WOR-3 bacterium JGI_Cruoil_03_44_89 TaxID=1973748 RepID=A0A235BT94_UNCW3|nr:MAG: hypothetical protein CH333_05105 [candidate division WOR-3 bacterium JGI_Cruoil_03_44_89]